MKKVLLSLGITAMSMIASIEATAGEAPRLRGFTTQKISIKNLEAMKKEWNANAVRLMMKPHYVKAKRRLKDDQAGWQYIMNNLPAYLDKAKKLNMAVILDLHGVPNDAKYLKDIKANKRAFWNDEKNLKLMIKCWQQIAEMCKNRKQTIWYDIFNEPLNWDDMPNSPKKWPSWAQQITDAIREIDQQHAIVIEPGPGGLCWGFKNFKPISGKNIIYSIHQYQPHQYTHQGIQALKGTDLAKSYIKTQRTWPGIFGDSGGGIWNKARIEEELKPAIDFQKKYKVKIYVGEFGVARWAPNADKYLQDCINIFEKYNWNWTLHAFRESNIWSLEHEETYGKGKAKKATKITKRGKKVRKYMGKN